MDITAKELREALNYNPLTGIFTWKISVAKRIKPGDKAASKHHHGYITFFFRGKQRQAHRMAWLYTHGRLPKGPMDHINCVRDDNRIANLRPVSPAGNAQNRRQQQKGAESGLLGVARNGRSKSWQAYIRVNNKPLYLGTYKTPEEAHEVYIAAKRKYHAACTL